MVMSTRTALDAFSYYYILSSLSSLKPFLPLAQSKINSEPLEITWKSFFSNCRRDFLGTHKFAQGWNKVFFHYAVFFTFFYSFHLLFALLFSFCILQDILVMLCSSNSPFWIARIRFESRLTIIKNKLLEDLKAEIDSLRYLEFTWFT